MNKEQKENTAKTLLDISKAVIIAFIIGGFISQTPIKAVDMILAGLVSVLLYTAAMMKRSTSIHKFSALSTL